MSDARLKKLADLLVNYSVKVQPEEWVLINGHMVAEPLISEVLRAVLEAGGRPQVLMGSDDITEYSLKYANDDQISWIAPTMKLLYEEIDVLISLRAFDNTRNMSGIDPKKLQLQAQSRQVLMKTYLERAAAGDLKWVLTNFPCPAYAQDADMSLREYEDFVYSATYCDKNDPVAEWLRIHDEQQKVVDWLNGKKEVVLKSPNVDLSLSVEGRTFINSDGSNNMPSGEVFTGPVEDSANGWVKYTYPAIEKGKESPESALSSRMAKLLMLPQIKMKNSCWPCWTPMKAPATWVNSLLEPTMGSRNSPRAFSMMKRSADLSTWLSVQVIRKQAVKMNPASTGT